MFGRVPAYTDISHFRAPYKNSVISGFGAETDATPPPPPTTAPVNAAMLIDVDERGYRFVKKELQPMLMATLAVYGTTFLGGAGNNVKIQPYTAEQLAVAATDPASKAFLEQMSAANWIKQQVDAGQVVFMTAGTLAAVLAGAAVPNTEMGTLKSGTPEAKEAAKSPIGVVVGGDPDGGLSLAGLGPVAIALVAAAAVGGIYYLAKRKGGRRAAAM